VPTSLSLVPNPGKDLFFPPAHHFFIKCILIVQEDFALVLKGFIYCALIKLTSPLLTHSLSPCYPNIQQLTVQCIISTYRWAISIFFIL
jgi:hypothetical protein